MREENDQPANPPGINRYDFALRLNYFDGQLLDANDFAVEQQYGRGMLQAAVSSLYGWGVARGLDVQWYPETDVLTLTRGMALDRLGRVILLSDNIRVTLPQASRERDLYLTIGYAEEKTAYKSFEGEEAMELVQDYTRITEYARIDLLPDRPDDDGLNLTLAKLSLKKGRITDVDVGGRTYTRLIAGDIEAKSIDFLTVEDFPTDLKIRAWREGGQDGLTVESSETRFTGSLKIAESLRIGGAGEPVSEGDAKASLIVSADSAPAALLGRPAPLSVMGDGPHLGFNALHDGMNWKGITPDRAMARISLDSGTGDLSFGTAEGRARSGDPAVLPDRMRITAEGTVLIDAAAPVPAGRLVVGGPGRTSALFGGENPLSAVFDQPGLGFNAYREDAEWKGVTPGKSAARLGLEGESLVFATQTDKPIQAAGAPVRLEQRARIDAKGLEVSGDVSVSGNLRTANSGVITGVRWNSLRPRVEAGNILLGEAHFGKVQKFLLPAAAPPEAVEVLVYAYAAMRNNDKDQSVDISVYTEEAPNQFVKYMFLRNFEVHPTKSWKDWLEHRPAFWHSISDNFWLPVTPARELNVIVTWYPRSAPPAAGEGMLFITGWR